jgi:glycogen synthase
VAERARDPAVARALQSERAMTMWPTRVLMTTDAGDGAWTHSLDLARGLRARGIDVVLAVLGPEPTAAHRAAVEALGVRLEHAALGLEWTGDTWRDLAAAIDWLLELERRHRCDVVHLHDYALATCPFASPKIVVARSCVLSWWESVRGQPAPPEWTRYGEAVTAGLAAAAHVVAPTRWMRQALDRLYGAPVRASVIHDARAPGLFEPAGKQPFVLGVGHVSDEAKNLPTLARAGRSLPWPVKIVGTGGAPTSVAAEGRADGAPSAEGRAEGLVDVFEDVELLGPLSAPEMAELYAHAAIFAAPARYESFGLTVLEAALSGCALVLGDIPSLRELWDDAAVFVPSDDASALSACLHDLVRHPELRHEMGVEAQTRAAAYRFDDMIDAYARVYAAAGVATTSPAAVDAATEARG